MWFLLVLVLSCFSSVKDICFKRSEREIIGPPTEMIGINKHFKIYVS